ncbi:multiple C2 and transmembrane domain-containing protein 1-like isoform X4 [Argiope bruennichi]|uniref:multiple C2 and transmembrane domain-containing protein 1-like isoform X4 n=1 Tax=Argiope bruennichi TaxID=94029 RepID=UPI00249566C5|nr:multiple C2 and transmembrane domain-containing protein 1-like isoform X4 [Argiope bruennichi]
MPPKEKRTRFAMTGDSDRSPPEDGVRRRKKFLRPKAKSQTDLSRRSTEDEEPSDLPPSPQPPSPYRKILGFRSGKKIHTVISTLRKFKLKHGRSKHYDSPEGKAALHSQQRLCASHPNVSTSDLASVAQGDVLPSGVKISDGVSYSDPTIHRNSSASSSPARGKARSVHPDDDDDTMRDSGITIDVPSQPGIVVSWPQDDDDDMDEGLVKQKHVALRQHAFYLLEVHLRFGKDLQARDACGTSDPYVKFKISGKQLYKSRTVNRTLEPYWDEFFTIPVDDVFEPLHIRVYDYDFAFQDDYMGAAQIDLTQLELSRPTDLAVTLTESGKPDVTSPSWGQIFLTLTLIPKTQEEKEQFFNKGSLLRLGFNTPSASPMVRRQKTQMWDSVVTIVLVEGKNLLAMDENGTSDPYVKFSLGNERYKSKVMFKTLDPQWLEQFNLHMYTDQPKILEISVYDKDFHGKDDFMGRCTIDLSGFEEERTHSVWKDLEDGAGSLFLLITISGTMGTETISDLASYTFDTATQRDLISKYGLYKTFKDPYDIGYLIVKVYKAQGLAAADLCGKSDPFCVVELVNARLQTHTEYKTLTPEWNKIFTFHVTDIHSMLEVTVYDEDRDKRCEFLGKVAIPLLKVRNGEKKWYVLKDKKLRTRAKGQILLEIYVFYNPIRASLITFTPKETKYMQQEQRFKRSIFVKNVNRVKMMLFGVVELLRFLNSCFLWESTLRSISAFVVFIVITYTFEFYMLPVALLILYVKNYVIYALTGRQIVTRDEDEIEEVDDEDDEEDKDERGEEKKTLKEKLQAVQDATAMIQNILGEFASFGERCKNTFNYTVPFLSWLAFLVLVLATVVLYFVPVRYLIMAWGINKFTKKLRNPHAVPNNELLDFISRVPDDEEKVAFRELKPMFVDLTDSDKKKKKKRN